MEGHPHNSLPFSFTFPVGLSPSSRAFPIAIHTDNCRIGRNVALHFFNECVDYSTNLWPPSQLSAISEQRVAVTESASLRLEENVKRAETNA